MDRVRASVARQRLQQAEAARKTHVQKLLGTGEMVEGAFVTLGRKCGKPTCRCATGEKHYSKFLSRSVDGRTRLVYVRSEDEVEVSRKAERYRVFRQARAELMKLAAETAELADEIHVALAEPYPTDKGPKGKKKPTQPPKRRHP